MPLSATRVMSSTKVSERLNYLSRVKLSQVGRSELGLSIPVPDQTAVDASGMRFCSRLVAGQEASATGAAHGRDMIVITSSNDDDEPCGGVLDRLKLPHEAV